MSSDSAGTNRSGGRVARFGPRHWLVIVLVVLAAILVAQNRDRRVTYVVRSDRDLRGGLGDRTAAAPPPTLTPKQFRRLNRVGRTARLPAELLRVWPAILPVWRPTAAAGLPADDALSGDAQIFTGCSYLADGRPHLRRARVTSNLRDRGVTLFCQAMAAA
jgi:hypothetical protein